MKHPPHQAQRLVHEESSSERLKAPAVRMNGNVYEGLYRSDAYFTGISAGEPDRNYESGCTTACGRFIDREQAWKLGRARKETTSQRPHEASFLRCDNYARIFLIVPRAGYANKSVENGWKCSRKYAI
jgi:hypothetical protein